MYVIQTYVVNFTDIQNQILGIYGNRLNILLKCLKHF